MKHAAPNSLVITLPPDQMELLDRLVASGQFPSKDDVVLDALKLWEERDAFAAMDDAYLKQQYETGLASGEALAVDIRDLKAKFKAAKNAKT